MLTAGPEAGTPARGVVVATWVRLAIAVPFLFAQIVGANADTEERDAAFDLDVDFGALGYENSDSMADNPPEDLTPGWDRNPRVDWSRRAGKFWELDPILLHRRQAGQPQQPGDDLSNKTLGIELRRRF